MIEPKQVVVVGAGVEAWIAATCLNGMLNDRQRRLAAIRVVGKRSHDGPGAAEPALPGLRRVLALAGIDETACLARTGATFNQAVRFTGWSGGEDGFYHPFDRHRTLPLDLSGTNWLRSDQQRSFAECVSAQPALCHTHVAPRPLPGTADTPSLRHGFHVDTQNLADVLREASIAAGVMQTPEKVREVDVDAAGNIRAVITASGERIDGDLFVDATGFDATLIGEHLEVPWVDLSTWLPCDREISLAVEHDLHYPGFVRSHTNVTAATAGWTRETPLQNRRTFGYIHSATHIGEDEALAELAALAGVDAAEGDVRTRSMPIGYRASPWVGNCIAVGAAAGFVEPLESTALHLSEYCGLLLAEHFPLLGDPAPLAVRFNRLVADRIHEIVDFTNLHYRLAGRRDSAFWNDSTSATRARDAVTARLDFWQARPPSPSDFDDPGFAAAAEPPRGGGPDGIDRPPADTGGLFGLAAYEALLYGSGYFADAAARWYGTSRPPARVLAAVAAQLEAAQDRLVTHERWLQQAAGMPHYANR